MDPAVLRALAKWPEAPDVYGWLALDRRGEWRIRSASATQAFERIGNRALREFICRNYAKDGRGRWYFQNGPQRVFVRLAYTPLVARLEGGALQDHCGGAFGEPSAMWLDEEGSLLLLGVRGAALLDDRDLSAFSALKGEILAGLPVISRAEAPLRFGYVLEPAPEA
ncbi:MAG: DUF2946 family protein [Betaproteobacteria bacterium]|nr:DUF2946 family protein [Betaproteobacteria bacterium]